MGGVGEYSPVMFFLLPKITTLLGEYSPVSDKEDTPKLSYFFELRPFRAAAFPREEVQYLLAFLISLAICS